jgi:predicted nucleotidyltransferase
MRQPPQRSDLPPLLAAIRSRIPDIRGIWLFGSLARDRARSDSDIDLGVLADAPVDAVLLFETGLALGNIASRDVDLVDLRRVSTVLRHVVATEGILVDEIDVLACAAFAADTAALYGALLDERQIAARLARDSDGT